MTKKKISRLSIWLTVFVICAVPAWASWTLVQHPNNAACSGTSCSVTVSATGSGHLITVIVQPNTATNTTISSVSGGGTYTHCTNCAASNGAGGAIDASYTLSSTSGATSISATLSQSGGASWTMEVFEYSFTNGPISLDASGNRVQTTNVANPAGVALTLTGTNDVIVQGGWYTTPFTAISSPYSSPADFPGGNGAAGAINTSSGTAPTWTATSGQGPFMAIAFKESTAAAKTCTIARMGAGPC